ncbi:MAG: AMP-binding protein [Pseudomonadales bacterium]
MSTDVLASRIEEAARVGMQPAVWAELQPDRVAIYDYPGQNRTFGELNANANRISRLLRASGLGAGDAIALLCSNRAEFCDVLLAALRTGIRCTPVNWHLTAGEIAYIVRDCDARALFADVRVGDQAQTAAAQCPALELKVAIGDRIDGFHSYGEALNPFAGADIADPIRGYTMLYTSGTTGRPKGVHKPDAVYAPFNPDADRAQDVYLCTGPAYHAAPLAGNVRTPLMNGLPVVFLDKWDSETVLRLIEQHRVTHTHMVPIMFQRLLALPEVVRHGYDTSSLKRITHGAAPCPPEVKHAMIRWLGPVLHEYYAGSEGGAGFLIDSEEWLQRPGSVGRCPDPAAARILGDDGNTCPPGTEGTIYLRLGVPFEYYKDPEKTRKSRHDDYFTLGDIGYLDGDGYLFLTGRSAETIIAGGVNIYPQEIDNELIKHPAVEDSCVIGIPHDEYGEEVKAVIQLKPGFTPDDRIRKEILDLARAGLARYKIPRSIDFVAELPRSAAGKILRNRVRERYWRNRDRKI